MTLLVVMPGRDTAAVVDGLRAADPSIPVRVWPDTGPPDEVELALVWNHPPGALASLPRLRAVCSFGAGVDHVLGDPELPEDVVLTRLVDPALVTDMVEFAVGILVASRRSFVVYHDQQHRHLWRPRAYSRRRTAVVLGQGELGAAVGGALASLGWRVWGWSRSGRAGPGVTAVVGWDDLIEVVPDAEAVICLLPLTPATEGILDAELFAAMAPETLLVNLGRGRHLVEEDLLAGLAAGRPEAAWLDVFAPEPLPADHPFWDHPRITVTPHVASLTEPAAAAGLAAETWRCLRGGRPLPHRVDRSRGY